MTTTTTATVPQRRIPAIKIFPALRSALALAGITMAEGLLIARKYAEKYGDLFDANQELFAFGAANIGAGLTGGFMGWRWCRTRCWEASLPTRWSI